VKNRALLIPLLGGALGGWCPVAAQLPQFTEVTSEAGITFRNTSGSAEKHYIIETQSAGVGWWDYDGDGELDLYFTNGPADVEAPESGEGNALYRGLGRGRFAETTAQTGLGLKGWNMGCSMADYDNDGDTDLFVTRWGPDALFRNDGKGRFAEVGAKAGVADPGWGIGSGFGDYDNDGDLDLYVANYVEFALHGPPFFDQWCTHTGIPAACGPKGFTAQRDALFRNEGKGHFTDLTQEAGIAQPAYYGMGVVWGDVDSDGDLDLYVANDGQPNNLFRNEGKGRFSDVAQQSGTAFSGDGRAQAGMGVALGDYDNDGQYDLLVTNFAQDYDTLYRNEGNGFFADVSGITGLAGPSRPFLSWGVFFFDWDQDGWQDIFIANGHLMPAIDRAGVGLSYRERNQLFRNTGQGRFEDVTLRAGPGMAPERVARGAACADYDGDGDLDVAVANLDDHPALLRNDGPKGHWLLLRLRGALSNRDGIGARVELRSASGKQYRQVCGGSSFQAQHDLRVHFGLGEDAVAETLQVHWPSGIVQTFSQVAADRSYTLTESSKSSTLE
jgi:hypothetical protein